jgi:hypothetical protein
MVKIRSKLSWWVVEVANKIILGKKVRELRVQVIERAIFVNIEIIKNSSFRESDFELSAKLLARYIFFLWNKWKK